MVTKNTAHQGCAGHIFSGTPKSHNAVPIALANSDAFKVLIRDVDHILTPS